MEKKIIKKNLKFLVPIYILLILSVINLYGASFISPLYKGYYLKQVMWIIVGTILLLIVTKINTKLLIRMSGILYIVGIVSLILVLVVGTNVNGSNAWFKLFGFTIQPSEINKFIYLIFLTRVIVKSKSSNFLLFIKIMALCLLPCTLIFLEPDTGVVLLYLIMTLGMIYENGKHKRLLVGLFTLLVVLTAVIFYLYFREQDLFISVFGTSFFYRFDRLLSFKNNTSYQLDNALTGIGASGVCGLGLTNPKIYIPEATTDFVFTLFICNFGYLGGIAVLTLYLIILINIYKEKNKSKKKSSRLILSGLFWMMNFQIWEHILMNIGLMPITGITLPFMSYGGSSLVSYFLILGLLLKITTSNSSYS